jgi:hypothetical protein
MTSDSKNYASALLWFAWLLALTTTGVAITVWGETLDWDTANISAYSFFPLLGLIGFSIMWAQYMAGALRRILHIRSGSLRGFSLISGSLVTTVIVLHPLTLAVKLWKDGSGFPPGSYSHYVSPNLEWAVLLGMVSLVIFLSFELRHKFRDRSWWHYVEYLNDAAIVAIYIHAYNLGTHTQFSWFRAVWLAYGITLSAALFYKYWIIVQAHNK